jgi:hypothetical protein
LFSAGGFFLPLNYLVSAGSPLSLGCLKRTDEEVHRLHLPKILLQASGHRHHALGSTSVFEPVMLLGQAVTIA